MTTRVGLANVRAVADAVLYEGYLLYPYRSTSAKNQSRWQFGVLGPPSAAADGLGEESGMRTQVLLRGTGRFTVTLRCLQLQQRLIEQAVDGGFVPVAQLTVGATQWVTWDEAVECEVEIGPFELAEMTSTLALPVQFQGGSESELLADGAGRVVRRRWPLRGEVNVSAVPCGDLTRLTVAVHNSAVRATTKDEAIRTSFIGAHMIISAEGPQFVSLLEPPDDAAAAVAGCTQQRCFPVLAGRPGDTDVMLASPIILYDYPEVAEQSSGALFDSTEIDEILSLRIMTLTEEEKAQARATDPKAAAIIDRCEAMTPQDMAALHGVLRDPHARLVPELDDEIPWWSEEADGSVQPDVDGVVVDGVRIAKGSLVTLRPSRRADAHDMFFAGQTARVALVHGDVDGEIHVGVILVDDPASEMHDWYGRYLYFAPDELVPLQGTGTASGENTGKESRQ
ncbi:hypothetical protein [Antrihabitans sp. YC2-6]|uniref:hypothetical protein n=1 Tax=Antrihabitans sp. YC2-6 TaxID=2799498 RepID=UPI0018F48B15|nr:hypothetical protein [Antrihabitans sp. YC2-6]MBJ8348469.1 hypothetical protein [Antrihabitans sp. YC2-6]